MLWKNSSRRPGLRAMTSDLRTRLLLMLVLPLCVLVLAGVWLDYRSADEAAGQHDQRLVRLLPALADSVLAPPIHDNDPPLLLLAPPIEEFLRQNAGFAAYSVRDTSGRLLLGEGWVHGAVPTTQAPEFHSVEFGGVTYRVAAQRGRTGAGELVVALADGSDPRQKWAQQLLLRVLLPNLVLLIAAGFAIHWAVRQAFKPLVGLAEAVERRSPRDLSPIDEAASPDEVRPLVHSLNRLFALVNAQAEGQRRFVADAAHQLRTPLAGLQAQVEAWAMMAKAAAPPRTSFPDFDRKMPLAHEDRAQGAIVLGADQIEKLRNATRRTSQLAHQLLALSRADARSLDAQPAAAGGPQGSVRVAAGNIFGRSHRQGPGPRARCPVGACDRPWLAAARAAVQPGGQRHQIHTCGGRGDHPLRTAPGARGPAPALRGGGGRRPWRAGV